MHIHLIHEVVLHGTCCQIIMHDYPSSGAYVPSWHPNPRRLPLWNGVHRHLRKLEFWEGSSKHPNGKTEPPWQNSARFIPAEPSHDSTFWPLGADFGSSFRFASSRRRLERCTEWLVPTITREKNTSAEIWSKIPRTFWCAWQLSWTSQWQRWQLSKGAPRFLRTSHHEELVHSKRNR